MSYPTLREKSVSRRNPEEKGYVIILERKKGGIVVLEFGDNALTKGTNRTVSPGPQQQQNVYAAQLAEIVGAEDGDLVHYFYTQNWVSDRDTSKPALTYRVSRGKLVTSQIDYDF